MKNKKFKHVLVVLGGTSNERSVSLESGKACIKALKSLNYKISTIDPKKKNFNLIDKSKTEVIFNALHGKNGEDGLAQSYFEYLRIPYTHSGIISSFNAMNKEISKEIFKKNKLLTPNYFIINKREYNFSKLNLLIRKKNLLFPIVVKPVNEGSSIGVKIARTLKIFKKSVESLLKKYDKLMIEKYIPGQEIQVAVLNGKSLGAIELVPKRLFYDYKAKYTKKAKTKHIMPARLNKKNYKKILKIAEDAHSSLKCRGVSRSDFKFYKGKFYLLEINTQPGMTSLSLVPEIAAYRGITFPKLVEKILFDASINK